MSSTYQRPAPYIKYEFTVCLRLILKQWTKRKVELDIPSTYQRPAPDIKYELTVCSRLSLM